MANDKRRAILVVDGKIIRHYEGFDLLLHSDIENTLSVKFADGQEQFYKRHFHIGQTTKTGRYVFYLFDDKTRILGSGEEIDLSFFLTIKARSANV